MCIRDSYNTDPDTEQLLLPSVEVDAYLARLVGPSFKLDVYKRQGEYLLKLPQSRLTPCQLPQGGSL